MVKLGDYGLPISLYSKENGSTLCHAAPEVFDGRREWKSDVWSLGITLLELAEGRIPVTALIIGVRLKSGFVTRILSLFQAGRGLLSAWIS